jgi:NADH-quinone oxidoreductase subunit M
MILSGLMAKMGLFSIVRWMIPAVPVAVQFHQPLIMVICVIGVVYGAVIAIQQTDLKRLIAYASLSHIALMVAGIFSLKTSGMEAAFVQAFAHGINTVGIFVCADILQSRLKTTDLAHMGGVRTAAPKFATVFFVIMFAMVALPFTNSFVGEIVLLSGVFEYNIWMALVAALSLVLGAVYMMRMFRRSMLGETNERTAQFADLTRSEKLVLFPLVVLIFFFGLCYQPLFDLTGPAVENILSNVKQII